MKSTFASLCGCLAVLCSSGCGGSTQNAAPAPATDTMPSPSAAASEVFRGIVNIAVKPVRIVRCGTPDSLTVSDAAGKLEEARTHLGPPAQKATALFVIADAHKESGSTLHIDDVVYTSPETFDCFADWQAFDYRSTGNKPGWVAQVLNAHIKLERQGAAPAEWNDARKDSAAQGVRITGAGPTPFQMLLERRACVNSVSGAYSAWSAQVTTRGVVLKGCTVRGG